MNAPRLLTLTTDFGHRDSYVGQMKGAVLSVAPDLRIVDLCHEIPAQQVATAAFVLETGYAAFPEGTVHLAVVDPGVGTGRRAIAVRCRRFTFVAPDNGILTRVLEKEPPLEIRAIPPAEAADTTFEGRDRFAPAAARLAAGLPLGELGPPVEGIERLPFPRPQIVAGEPVRVAVISVDRFGNAILDLPSRACDAALGAALSEDTTLAVRTPGGTVTRFQRTYGAAPHADPFLLVNSAGYLELALFGARADRRLGLRSGMLVELTIGET